MPLTFPAHAAAILPLLHLPGTRRLLPSALVVGSTAPDLSYLVGVLGADSHVPRGLFNFCLPAGLLAFLYLEWLLLPVVGMLLSPLLPKAYQQAGSRLLHPRPLPRRLTEWLGISLAILIGAATHQLWDGFTHPWMWPTRALYPDLRIPLLGYPLLFSRLLQHISSILGTVVVLLYVHYVVAPASTGEPRREDQAGGTPWLLHLVLWPLLAGVVAGIVRFRHESEPLAEALWLAAWSFMSWFTLLLGAGCLLVRVFRIAHR